MGRRSFMKRVLALILSVVLLCGIAIPAYATGDGNFDGGGVIGTPVWTVWG